MRRFLVFLLLSISMFMSSCASAVGGAQTVYNAHSKKSVKIHNGDILKEVLTKSNVVYEINEDIDLRGAEVKIGNNSALKFRGGSLKNGSLVGSATKVEGDAKGIFESMHFKGTWIIPDISTDMWKSLDYPNSLKDVFSLLNPNIQNTLTIEKYNYDYTLVAPDKGGILEVADNTELIINGNIVLKPNGYQDYEMIRVTSCKNVAIKGCGSVSGDRRQHDYTTTAGSHEWGMGIIFRACQNIDLSGITVKDMTGDALCLMDNCSGFKIHNMEMKDCRRCGISIRADHDIAIENCTFSGIVNDKYNEPSAAIDIEPVVDCKVYNINIKNCNFNNIARGISSNARNYYGKSYTKGGKTVTEGRHYINLTITNCRFENSTYTSFIAPFGWETVKINNCTFHNGRQEDIRVGYVGKCIIRNCNSSCDEGLRASLGRSFVTTFYENKSIRVEGCDGNNMKRVFSDKKNCKIVNSRFTTR